MKTTRTYTMTSRARGVAETRRRVLDATVDLHGERLAADISLDDIAERAGVSVQTVLRHFGSRSGLVEAAFAHARAARPSAGPRSATSPRPCARSSTTTSCAATGSW
jgi:AcrR family transcriptional regulator